jgi:hypothetical protein
VERVPFERAPLRTQRTAALVNAQLLRDGRDAEGRLACTNTPVVAFFFTAEEDGAGGDGSLSVAYAFPEWLFKYLASNPKYSIHSSLFGDCEIDLNSQTLQE